MNREDMLKRLMVLDFMAVDLQLFLDTHPHDSEAIEKYNSVIAEGDKLRAKYEENFGPLYSFRSSSERDFFSWIDEPVPWQNDFNFSLDVKGE